MFELLRNEVDDRLLVCRQQLALIARLEAEFSGVSSACKGMYFVQLYALYEYTLKAAVRALISGLLATTPEMRSVRPEVLALVLDPMWKSVSSSGKETMWDARISVAGAIVSDDRLGVDAAVPFPADGSHYRVRQLHTVWKILGLPEPIVAEPRYMGRIEELVENRNFIAHGEKTPEEVGGRFSHPDLVQRTDDIAAVVSHVVQVMQDHALNNRLLRN